MALSTRTRIEIFVIVIGLGIINRVWGDRVWADAFATFFAVVAIGPSRRGGDGRGWLVLAILAIVGYALLALAIVASDGAVISDNLYLKIVVAVGMLGWLATITHLYRTRDQASHSENLDGSHGHRS